MKQRPDDRSELYVLSDLRRRDMGPSRAVPLDDLAHVLLRALDAQVAVIVVDGVNRWMTRKVGTAASASCQAAAVLDQADLAQLVNPTVAETKGFQFYAATPLRDESGVRFGTLAILAEEIRSISEDDLATLRKMAGIIERVA